MSAKATGSPGEIFLSHSSKDRNAARLITETLRAHGLPVWHSATNLIGAQQWHDEIGEALDRCDWFIVLLSPHAITSPWVKRELLYALRTPRFGGRIVPIVHRKCDYARLSWTLDDCQIVNFVGDREAGFRSLLRIWGTGYRGSSPTTSDRKQT